MSETLLALCQRSKPLTTADFDDTMGDNKGMRLARGNSRLQRPRRSGDGDVDGRFYSTIGFAGESRFAVTRAFNEGVSDILDSVPDLGAAGVASASAAAYNETNA